MRTGLPGFSFLSATLLVCSAFTASAEEMIKPASSIFAADGRIPASIEEMLPAHTRLGLERSDWVRLTSGTARNAGTAMSLQTDMAAEIDEKFAGVYRRLEERNDLFPPPPSQNRFVRATDAIFTPAPIRLGSTYISFTPVTAWKKRNPLCLLNPLVLTISW
jgi:hypothetical protein